MAVSKTQWWDKNGNPNVGYIKDGQTFTDEATTQRVPVGATVQTAGGTYKMTGNGGVPTYATARNNYVNAGNAAIAAYEAASKAQEDRINSATNAAISELNRQKGIAQKNRVDANRAAQSAYLAASNPYGAAAESMARLGLSNSGYAESSKLRLASDYAGQLTENIRSMNEQLGMLDVQIAEARASGKYELANMLEARAQNVMSQKMALEGSLLSADTNAIAQAESARQHDESMAENIRQYNEQTAMKREQLATAETNSERDYLRELALNYIQATGKVPEFAADVLPLSPADASALAAAYAPKPVVKSSGGSGGLSASEIAKIEEKKANTQYLTSAVNAWKASGMDLDTWIGEIAKSYGITSPADIKEFRTIAEGGVTAPAGNGNYYDVIRKQLGLKGYTNEQIAELARKGIITAADDGSTWSMDWSKLVEAMGQGTKAAFK